MAEFIQKEGGYSMKKSEVLMTQNLGRLSSVVTSIIDDVIEKLKSKHIKIETPEDLIIKNDTEYIAILAIRENEKETQVKEIEKAKKDAGRLFKKFRRSIK